MSLRKLFNHRSTLIISIGLSLTACDSAVITGPGSTDLSIGAAMAPALLLDADFETGSAAWQSCSTNGSSALTADASEGSQAMNISNGGCLYQNINVDVGTTYRLSCETKSSDEGWSSATLAFLDQNSQPLDSREQAITTANYSTLSATMTAPAFSSIAEVLFYSEGSASIDDCKLEETTITLPAVGLTNGSFDNGLTGWEQCQSPGTVEVINGAAVLSNGACIYQTIDVSEPVSLSPDNQPMTLSFLCDDVTKTGSEHASFIVAFLDEAYQPVATKEFTIDAATSSSAVRLDAPQTSAYAEVMAYSDATITVGECSVSNQ